MSAIQMAENAVARSLDQPQPTVMAGAMRAAEIGGTTPANVSSKLEQITAHIPVEVLTVYVAVLAVSHDPKVDPYNMGWFFFFAFLLATPVVVWVLFATRLKQAQQPIPSPAHWPWWEMAAGSLSFVVWAFALPESPFSTLPWYSSALSGVAVLAVSTALGLLAPLFQSANK